MSNTHQAASLESGTEASIPVRPCISFPLEPVSDLLPNVVYEGGVVPEGDGPAEEEGEIFEEWIPSTSSTTPAIPEAVKRYHVLGVACAL